MIGLSSLLSPLLERVMKRSIALDPDIPSGVILGFVLAVAGGLARGLVMTRRKLVLYPGARVSDVRRLHTNGGLVRIGAYSRVECTSRMGIRVGHNFKLGAFSRMIASGSLADLGQGIRIGDNVGIGEFAYIGGSGGLDIGDNTIVGQYFSVHPENHIFINSGCPIREQGVTREGIKIGPGCWIGAKVTITDGVTIGENSVIAAGSVVTKCFPANTLIGGVPARLLRSLEARESNDER